MASPNALKQEFALSAAEVTTTEYLQQLEDAFKRHQVSSQFASAVYGVFGAQEKLFNPLDPQILPNGERLAGFSVIDKKNNEKIATVTYLQGDLSKFYAAVASVDFEVAREAAVNAEIDLAEQLVANSAIVSTAPQIANLVQQVGVRGL